LTTIGKKEIRATTMILGAMPYPTQISNNGAMAIIGTVWDPTTNG
jgi:hypothetical protein